MVISLTVFDSIWINHDASHQDIQDQTSPPVIMAMAMENPMMFPSKPRFGIFQNATFDYRRWNDTPRGYGSIPINTIFSGMNIHLPAILMFTRGTRFWHTATLTFKLRYWLMLRLGLGSIAMVLILLSTWLPAARHCQKRFLKLWQEKH
jgi:hypothetical protein